MTYDQAEKLIDKLDSVVRVGLAIDRTLNKIADRLLDQEANNIAQGHRDIVNSINDIRGEILARRL